MPMRFRFLGLLLIIFLSLTGFLIPVFAQNAEQNAVAEQEARLRAELRTIEAEIAQQQEILRAKQRESVSLERDIAILNAQIKQAQLKIQAQNINIQQLGRDISFKSATIVELDERIGRGRESLAALIRKTNELDEFSIIEVVLANEDLSEFFGDLDSFQSIKRDLQTLFENIRDNKALNESEREILQDRRNKEADIKVSIESEKRNIEKAEAQKKDLLAVNKNQEKTYEDVLKERGKRAAEIRSALFSLRDTAAIPFGTALTYANIAYARTGVRPAFLLAILTQESNLGENVGTCNRPGDPPEKSWRNIMPGPNDNSWRDDQTTYLRITSQLGFDPDSMPLSCPWGGGWGGAMGPAQFIPTTWDSYQARIAAAVGKSVPNPWDPQDAFMASALYLSDLGANQGGYTAERTAALKYYAGSNWQKAVNAFYGNQVMIKAQNIQENMIDPLQGI